MKKTFCDKCGVEAPVAFHVYAQKYEDVDFLTVDTHSHMPARANDCEKTMDLCPVCWGGIKAGIQIEREKRGLMFKS